MCGHRFKQKQAQNSTSAYCDNAVYSSILQGGKNISDFTQLPAHTNAADAGLAQHFYRQQYSILK